MSHFSVIKTTIRNKDVLIQAIKALGFIPICSEECNLIARNTAGLRPEQCYKVNILIESKYLHDPCFNYVIDLGIKFENGEAVFIYDGWYSSEKNLISRIKKEYSRISVLNSVKELKKLYGDDVKFTIKEVDFSNEIEFEVEIPDYQYQ